MNLYDYKPKKEFAQKHMLRLSDYTPDEIYQLLAMALKLKQYQKNKQDHKLLRDKILAMIFTKSSTRTRVSFEAGIYQLGGTAQFLSANDIQLGRGEPISDTAKVLSRMVDGIMIRTFAQSDVDGLAKYGSIPVINGLTDFLHPCQVLADLMTYYENFESFKGKMAFIGDGNNVANSLLVGCAKVGLDITVACPDGYEPDAAILAQAKQAASETGAEVIITHNPRTAAEGATAIYTDVWASMGQESQADQKYSHFSEFQVNSALMSKADKKAIFLHCLPAHRGEEVTAEVIDGSQSAVFDEAENRLHAQKAVMAMLMKN